MTKNILIAGVGGQGTLLASRLLGTVLLHEGFDVKVSEVHGMSQRGGTVVTYVRYGEKVYAPTVEQGDADFIVAFEALEAARFLPYLKADGILIANTQQIAPMPVITGAMPYPEQVLSKVGALCNLIAVDAISVANELNSPKSVNIVLMGVLSTLLPFDLSVWESALETVVKPQYLSVNRAAFAAGRKLSYAKEVLQ